MDKDKNLVREYNIKKINLFSKVHIKKERKVVWVYIKFIIAI